MAGATRTQRDRWSRAGSDLKIYRRNRQLLWQTSEKRKPEVVVRSDKIAGETRQARKLFDAATPRVEPFRQGRHKGYRVLLSAFPDCDIQMSVVFAIDAGSDELLVEAAPHGGSDRVQQIDNFYCIEKPVSAGGYVVVPHGSGYLVPAEAAEKLEAGSLARNVIGYRYTLPLFGMVKGADAFFQIVDSYWDCSVATEHLPGDRSSLNFHWLPSLGELRYPCRFRMRFAEGLDHVGMAKAYRKHAQAQGLFRTLHDKAKGLPAIRQYVGGIEYRWVGWKGGDNERALSDASRLRESGLSVNFFFPKWASKGYPEEQGYSADAGWQAFIRPEPVREGWKGLAGFAESIRNQGGLVKIMINPNTNFEGAPAYDPAKASLHEAGQSRRFPALSTVFGPQVLQQALDSLQKNGLKPDALYFDGFSAHSGHGEDFSAQHPVTRREGLDHQIECFRETRRRGIIPGAELPRFWAVADCDFFFFDSGWSADRLPVGEPIPLFQLVFRECYAACFSGGGYGRYDWPKEKNPRLYELLFGAAPGYNWMLPYIDGFPGLGLHGGVPIGEWGEERMQRRIEWLRRWSAFYQAVAYAEMTTHEFLNSDRTLQRTRFANGVTAEFDMARGLCRIHGVRGFSGEWEKPHEGSL